MGATGPCKYCSEYPHHCAYQNGCPDKARYINEVNENTPIVSRSTHRRNTPKKKENGIFLKNGKAYVYNKNGIRKEVPIR